MLVLVTYHSQYWSQVHMLVFQVQGLRNLFLGYEILRNAPHYRYENDIHYYLKDDVDYYYYSNGKRVLLNIKA